MKVIITETFRTQYDKFRGKQRLDLKLFCTALSRDIAKEIRYLHRPYLKIKANIGNKALRLFAVCFEHNDVLIPLYLTDKNDKTIGHNMTRENIAPFVPLWEQKMNNDLENNNFVCFEE